MLCLSSFHLEAILFYFFFFKPSPGEPDGARPGLHPENNQTETFCFTNLNNIAKLHFYGLSFKKFSLFDKLMVYLQICFINDWQLLEMINKLQHIWVKIVQTEYISS